MSPFKLLMNVMKLLTNGRLARRVFRRMEDAGERLLKKSKTRKRLLVQNILILIHGNYPDTLRAFTAAKGEGDTL